MSKIGRRGFLSFLGGGIVGLSLADTLPKWLVYDPGKVLLPGAGLDAITAAIMREFQRQWNRPSACVPYEHLLPLTEGVHHFHVTSSLYRDREFATHEKLIKPVADVLVDEAKRRGLHRFGQLPMLQGGTKGAVVVANGVAIRGVAQYDIGWDTDNLRFDILGSAA